MPLPSRAQYAPIGQDIGRLSLEGRLKAAIEATLPKLPRAVGRQLVQLLNPKALAVMASVVIIWAGLQFTGVGEVADVALLVVGWFAVGGVAVQGGRELVDFAVGVYRAKTSRDIDRAAAHLATAISLLGVQAVLMMLLHTAPKPYKLPGRPAPRLWKDWWDIGPPPRSRPGRWFYKPSVKVVPSNNLGGALGVTSAYGDIEISSALSEADAQATLLHEQVHAALSPKLYFLRNLRAQMMTQGYSKSVILRYLEEAMAETYSQLRTKGLDMNTLITGITFPVNADYGITIAKAGTEVKGILFGPITVGGMIWNVWVNRKQK